MGSLTNFDKWKAGLTIEIGAQLIRRNVFLGACERDCPTHRTCDNMHGTCEDKLKRWLMQDAEDE